MSGRVWRYSYIADTQFPMTAGADLVYLFFFFFFFFFFFGKVEFVWSGFRSGKTHLQWRFHSTFSDLNVGILLLSNDDDKGNDTSNTQIGSLRDSDSSPTHHVTIIPLCKYEEPPKCAETPIMQVNPTNPS
jgi:hypothetical protein